MSLTGTGLPWLLGVCALILFALIVMGYPTSTRRWLRRLFRGFLVILLNVTVLLWAAVHFNNEYQFYTSWQDLLGEQTSVPASHHGSTPQRALAAGHLTSSPLMKVAASATRSDLPAQHGRQFRVRVHGQHSGITSTVIVQLPKNYDPTKAERYPVIELLHGYPSGPDIYNRMGGFFDLFDASVKRREIADAILVIPQISANTGVDTECVDTPHGAKTETWLARDVPEWVVSHLHAKTDRASWATFGFSMGGWCANMLTINHPETYGAAISMQGYFQPQFALGSTPFTRTSPQGRRLDLLQRLRHNPPPVALWTLSSAQDSLSYPTSHRAVSAVRAPTSMTSLMLPTGGHRFAVWMPRVPMAFAWLGESLPGFHTHHGRPVHTASTRGSVTAAGPSAGVTARRSGTSQLALGERP